MRLTHKLMLLAVTAIAAMAMSAASASALTVKAEATGTTCSSVSKTTHGTGSGGCLIHATSDGLVELGWFGSMITCNNEFTGRTNGSGVGFIESKTLTNCSGSVTPCAEAAGQDVWPSNLNGENSQEVAFCVVAFGATINCTIEHLFLVDGSWSHLSGTVGTASAGGHQDCDEFNGATFTGDWMFETFLTPEVEVVD